MHISEKLALEIYTISIFHVVTILILFSFSMYIYFRAKKSPLLYSYLALVAMMLLWMVSKIMKTLSPTQELRWFFIETQYFSIDLLGLCLLVFAYVYTNNRLPSKKALVLWSILPILSFMVVITNPWHMRFYSYFDFYKDKFGILFYVVQSVQYVYLIIGICMLSRKFTQQRSFYGKRLLGILFSVITLIPLLANVYYILFKLSVFKWIFPFPVFDFTPIAGSVSLILFMIPALPFRFFDISPVTYSRLFELMPSGVCFTNTKGELYGGNISFYSMFSFCSSQNSTLTRFSEQVLTENSTRKQFLEFCCSRMDSGTLEFSAVNGKTYRMIKHLQRSNQSLLIFDDITDIVQNRMLLLKQNEELSELNSKLDKMAEKTGELAAARMKSQMAQHVHDILGHSLTVVIGMAELAAVEENKTDAQKKLSQISELLMTSLVDLKKACNGDDDRWGKTSLIKAIECLQNDVIQMTFSTQGAPYELNTEKTQAVFRLCQEAITNAIRHGRAKSIYIILRYKSDIVEVYAIDNGSGCANIKKNHGLNGIEKRIHSLDGTVEIGSDGESGFSIHATIPK